MQNGSARPVQTSTIDRERAAAALSRFVADDPGRSVALRYRQPDAAGVAAQPITVHVAGDAQRPVASVIKVALAMAVYDEAAAGTLSLAEQVPVAALGETRYCSIMKAFDASRTLSLAELTAIALVTSDNPVAVYLMDRIGCAVINRVLQRAGIAPGRKMSVGFREEELGPSNRANMLSALDVVALFDLLSGEPAYQPIIVALENNLRNARIPALLPDAAVIAHKTGSLDGVVNDAGIVRLGERAFTIAFLCDGQPDPLATSADIARCVLAIIEA